MGELCGIRAPRPAAGLLVSALLLGCCLGVPAVRAVAEEAPGADRGGIRILKGVQWSDDWSPPSEACPSASVRELRGVRWDGAAARSSAPRPGASPTESAPPAEIAVPDWCLPSLPRVAPADAWADLFRPPAGATSEPQPAPAPAPPHVTVLVLPPIFGSPPRAQSAGGSEACEVRTTTDDDRAAAPRVAPSAGEERLAAPAPPVVPAEPAPREQPPRDPAYPPALVQFVSTAAAVLVALSLFCGCLVALRRLGLVGPFGLAPAAAVAAAPPDLPAAPPAPESALDLDTAESFDLGPTYAEEARQRERDATEREQAVLRRIFEQNVLLREQIDELTAAGEQGGPGQPGCEEGSNG